MPKFYYYHGQWYNIFIALKFVQHSSIWQICNNVMLYYFKSIRIEKASWKKTVKWKCLKH